MITMAGASKGITIKSQPPSIDYDDRILFGTREKVITSLERNKSGNDSECVVYAVGTFADKKQWKLKNLTGIDRRLQVMMRDLGIGSILPIQGYCWPKISSSVFPIFCISPEGTGKTFAHLLYIVSKSIASVPVNKTDLMISCENEHQFEPDQGIDPVELLTHPNYIIVCSSQHQSEQLVRHVCHLKEKAYGSATESRCLTLPPIVNTINVHQDEEKLAFKCCRSEIMIATPNALLKCLKAGYLNFSRCKKIIFDDLDLALQLHNSDIFMMFKMYFSETLDYERVDGNCSSGTNVEKEPSPFCFFSRKWTDLVRNFVKTVSLQRIIIFGSIAEASIYSKLKFEIEPYETECSRIDKLSHLLKLSADNSANGQVRLAIVCKTDEEALELGQKLQSHDHNVKVIIEEQIIDEHETKRTPLRYKTNMEPIRIISDGAIDLEVDVSSSRNPLNSMTHIIHHSLPKDLLTFDNRFRLMYKNIQNKEKGLISTIFIGPDFRSKQAKQLFDLLCRSTTTLTGTKLMLKDHLNNKNDAICWRWATTGSCKLEKLSRGDKFGTYCLDKHQVNGDRQMGQYPTSGQVKITLTHVVSPSEFFFRFEAHRDVNKKDWQLFGMSGHHFMTDLQRQLDKLKDAQLRSVPLCKILKGKVYGVYFQEETRVDRVLLLGEPKHDQRGHSGLDNKRGFSLVNQELEFTKQVPVIRIDYGSRLEVFIKNLIELPQSLASIPAQAHRGFYLGVKPADNEPFWPYKAKKAFYDSVNSHDVTVWLRLNSDGCFWFEYMQATKRPSIMGIALEGVPEEPYRDLCSIGLAEPVGSEPNCLLPSVRNHTISRWHSEYLCKFTYQAFLEFDSNVQELFILDLKADFKIIVRHKKFNKQLIQLEDDLIEEYTNGKVINQTFLEKDVLCLVKIIIGYEPGTKKPQYALNRAKVLGLKTCQPDLESPDDSSNPEYKVYCLDHGICEIVPASDIYKLSKIHLERLPFQAIACQLANINPAILGDKHLNFKTRNIIIDLTRDEDNEMKGVRVRFDAYKHLYLYLYNEDQKAYLPLTRVLEQLHGIRLYDVDDPEYDLL